MSERDLRLAGAPISWGVCEAPEWGIELPPDRVLGELAGLGLRATELGPTGYLGERPSEVRALLDRYGLSLVGGFLPVPMHAPSLAELAQARAAMETLAAAGSEVVVLAARSLDGSYERKVVLTDAEWPVLLSTLDGLRRVAADLGLLATLHPHVGTAIEDRAAVLRVLDDSDVPLCLDTGHLVIGGTDPVELVAAAADRIAHVHLKDVRSGLAETVSRGDRSYLDAVRAGLYAPLGDGDVDIAAIVQGLNDSGYPGWYVLEQDVALSGPPAPGSGPVADVRQSVEYLHRVARTEEVAP
jgi:inosose dehydratase